MIKEKIYLNFEDVLIEPRMSEVESRSEVDLSIDLSEYNPLFEKWKPIPIMSANMDTVTDANFAFEMVKENMIAVLHKYVSIEDIIKLFDKIDEYNKTTENKIDYRNVFISRGTSNSDKEKLKERLEKETRIKSVCIDVANGYRKSVIEYIKELKAGLCYDKILMVGNIAGDHEVVTKYIENGVDIIKAGIGPGSACITRVQTGVGVPQITMIEEINKYINYEKYKNNFNWKKVLLCSDGGCKVYGDIAKAFCAGANFVMLGGMLAGHKENPGEMEEIEGKKLKRFSGMAAKESQWNGVSEDGVEEGKTVFLEYKGKIIHTLKGIKGGLKSACTYTNSKNLKDLIENGNLIRVTVQENKFFS